MSGQCEDCPAPGKWRYFEDMQLDENRPSPCYLCDSCYEWWSSEFGRDRNVLVPLIGPKPKPKRIPKGQSKFLWLVEGPG